MKTDEDRFSGSLAFAQGGPGRGPKALSFLKREATINSQSQIDPAQMHLSPQTKRPVGDAGARPRGKKILPLGLRVE